MGSTAAWPCVASNLHTSSAPDDRFVDGVLSTTHRTKRVDAIRRHHRRIEAGEIDDAIRQLRCLRPRPVEATSRRPPWPRYSPVRDFRRESGRPCRSEASTRAAPYATCSASSGGSFTAVFGDAGNDLSMMSEGDLVLRDGQRLPRSSRPALVAPRTTRPGQAAHLLRVTALRDA